MNHCSDTARRCRRASEWVIGPFAFDTRELAVTVSVLLHVVVFAAAAIGWSILPHDRSLPQFQQGRQAVAAPTVRFVSAAELQRMMQPPESPEVLETPRVPDVAVEPPEMHVSEPPVEAQEELSPPKPATTGPLPVSSPPPPEVVAKSKVSPVDVHAPATEPAIAERTPPAVASASDEPMGVTRGATVAKLTLPKYPQMSRRLGEEGLVLLAVSVDAEGKVTDVRVISEPGYPRLVEAAIAAVRRAKFTVAMENGRPVASVVRVPIRFRLESAER